MVLGQGKFSLALMVALVAPTNACKEGVVPGKAYENPVSFAAMLISPLPPAVHPLLSVIWTDPWQNHPDVRMPTEWLDSSVAEAADRLASGMADDERRTASTFRIRLFRPPPAATLVEVPSPDGTAATLSLGEIMLVDDQDRDGTFAIDAHGTVQGADVYLAGGKEVMVYVEKGFPPSATTKFDLAPDTSPGYHLVNYQCDGRELTRSESSSSVRLEAQPSVALIQRRTCLRTHAP